MKSLLVDLTIMTIIVCIVTAILIMTVFPITEIRGSEQAPVPPQAPPIPKDKILLPISDGIHEWKAYSDGDTTQVMLMKRGSDKTLYQVGVYIFSERKYYRLINSRLRQFKEESPPILPPEGPIHNHKIDIVPDHQHTLTMEGPRQYYTSPILQRGYGGYGSYGANCGPRG